MIQDFMSSFKENIKQKTTNPFFGTLIIVWLIDNWELIYTVFNFEEGKKLQEKIDFISKYLAPSPFLQNLGMCIIISLFILTITYLLLNISRLIVNLYEKQLTPWIYKITDTNSIVLKEDYLFIKSERDELLQKYDNEREQKLKLQNEIDRLELKIVSFSDRITNNETTDSEQESIKSLVAKLIDNNLITMFHKMVDIVNNKAYSRDVDLAKSKQKNELLRLGLFVVSDNTVNGKRYGITDLGAKVNDFIIENS